MSKSILKAGVKEAARILINMGQVEAQKILEKIAKSDSQLAEKIKNNMVAFDDLQYLTPKMLSELLQEISLPNLGLALRMGSPKLIKHILTNVSSGMGEEIKEYLAGPPQRASEVQEAVKKIVGIVLRKVEKGELILKNREGSGNEFV